MALGGMALAKRKKSNGKRVTTGRPDAARGRRNRNLVVGLLVLVVAAAAALWVNYRSQNVTQDYTIQTARGNIVIAVYPRLEPVTVANFAKLVNMGFYNGLTFHRVENWVIQGGDPKGDGTGGPGWTIPLETNPRLRNVRGAVAMARSQNPDSAGSQFYILKTDAPWLDGQYAVFGKVISGMSVVDRIEKGDKMISIKPGP